MKLRALALTLLAAAVVAGCGGGVPSSLTPSGSQSAAARPPVKARVTIHIRIHRRRHRHRAHYLSPATKGLTLAFSGPTKLDEAIGLTPATDPRCSNSQGVTTCTIGVALLAGHYTGTISTYDRAPVNGSIPPGAQMLSTLRGAPFTMVGGIDNALNFTLGGVLSGIALALPSPSIHGTAASQQQLSVLGLDADGFTIVGGWVDTNDNPVTIALSASPNPSGEIGFGSTSLSSPPPNGVTLSYNGAATAAYASTITAAASDGPKQTATLTLLGPSETAFTVPGSTPNPFAIAPGPDGNLWFTALGTSQVGRITTGGTIAMFTPQSCPCTLQGITSGPDGNVWEADTAHGLQQTTTAGVSTLFVAGTKTARPVSVVTGPDQNLWFTLESGAKIGTMTTAGAETDYSVTGGTSPLAIVAGPDNNLWFTENAGNAIGVMTTGGTLLNEFPLPHAGSLPAYIAVGPDGNLWFTEQGAARVGRITTGGTITEFTLPSAGAGFTAPLGITGGPDGNVWFVEQGPASAARLGRITPSGTMTEYPVANGTLQLVTLGPDGNLWYTDQGNQTIRRFVW